MKTKKGLLTILAIFIMALSFATEKAKLRVITLDSEKALIAANSEAPTIFEVCIKNHHNETLYHFKSKEKNYIYRGKFDFSALENGEYFISVSSAGNNLKDKLTVESNCIKSKPEIHSAQPYVLQQENKLNVSFLNSTQTQVYYNIYKGGKRVAGGNLGKNLSIQKRLDISKLDYGEYDFVLSDKYDQHSFIVHR